MSQQDEKLLRDCEDQISVVLHHPAMSSWLKDALRSALPRDPLAVLNDLEILNTLLRPRSEALIRRGQVLSKR